MALDNRDEFIRDVVAGKTFLEVGGLWGAVNEKATVAHAAGAKAICALDIWKPETEWWLAFRSRCASVGLVGAQEVIGSIDNVETIRRLGIHDVVHCAGVLYHCANPFLTLSHLRAVTGETLLLTAAVMPEVIENEYGRIQLDPDFALCVPCLTEEKRRVADLYLRKAYGGGAFGVNAPIKSWFFNDGAPNYGPWWWLWTAQYLERLVSACGFEIVKTASQYNGTGHLLMLKKTTIAQENYGEF
jgi:hypothetical protein